MNPTVMPSVMPTVMPTVGETHRILRPLGSGPYVLICDHASNRVPDELNLLGVDPAELTRHIAWDIGAAGVTEALSAIFDAPAILCSTTRLVIDCNRKLGAVDLIPEVSDGTVVSGNARLSESAKAERVKRYYRPYHDAIESVLLEREARGGASILISIHSMNPTLGGVSRPWEIAVSSYLDRSLAEPLLAALRRPGDVTVGDNEPYDLDPRVDYSVPYHALRRGLQQVQMEFRNDAIADESGQARWALRFADALRVVRD